MYDINELLVEADEFLADVAPLFEAGKVKAGWEAGKRIFRMAKEGRKILRKNPAYVKANRRQWQQRIALGAGGIATSQVVGSSVARSVERKGKRGRAAGVRSMKSRHGITAKSFIPKDKYQMQKLATRGKAGHVGHGALRSLTPFGAGNITRYAHKVKMAKRGIHRNM